MLNSLTQTQPDTPQKWASSASKSILLVVNIEVMAPTYHGKACGSYATLSSESGTIAYFWVHIIQFCDLEPLNNKLGNELLYRPFCLRALVVNLGSAQKFLWGYMEQTNSTSCNCSAPRRFTVERHHFVELGAFELNGSLNVVDRGNRKLFTVLSGEVDLTIQF
jgi:hypothetical protein